MNRSTKKLPTRPFFARFLDQQKLEEVIGGADVPKHTLKFPSDDDEASSDI
jgi:hypothetical protein